MKNAYFVLLTSAVSLFSACTEKKEVILPASPATSTDLVATIDSPQQRPLTPSTATGTFVGKYDSGTKQLTYTITYQGMTASDAHIHTGAPGEIGGITIRFASLASPITGTTAPLTSQEADNLLNNRMYVNIHSTTYRAGEIRGDIKKK